MTSLNDRLSQIANLNAQRVGNDKPTDSNDGIVVGVDKTTGDYLIKKNGTIATAKSTGNSGIKLGVANPVMGGKVLNPETPQKKKAPTSVPVAANRVENSFYIAYLPVPITATPVPNTTNFNQNRLNGIGFYPTGEYGGSDYLFHSIGTLGPSLRSYVRYAPFELPEGFLMPDFYVGWDECTPRRIRADAPFDIIGSLDMSKSVAYKLLKSVIDFVFPVDEGDTKRSDQVLIPNTRSVVVDAGFPSEFIREEKEFLLDGIQRPLSAGDNSGAFDMFDIVVVSLNESSSFPFNLKQLMKRKFTGIKNGTLKKVLFIIHNGNLNAPVTKSSLEYPLLQGCRPAAITHAGFGLPIGGTTVWDVYDTAADREFYRARWLAGVVTEQLLGVAACGEKMSIGTNATPGVSVEDATLKKTLAASSLGGGAPAPVYGDVSGISEWDRGLIIRDNVIQTLTENELIESVGGSRWGGLFWSTHNPGNYIADQKQFAPLLSELSESVGSTIYFGHNHFFKGLSEVSPIQPIYGDMHTPHCWIKGVTEEEIDAIDPVAMADEYSISKPVQYIHGLDAL